MAPQEMEPKLPARVGGSPVEAWFSRGSLLGLGYWQQLSGEVPFVISSLGDLL